MLRRRSNQYITKEFLWTNQASGITAPSIGDSNGNRLVLDHENVWRACKAEEVRSYGYRRVENLLSYSEDNVNLTFPTQANAVIAANTIELTGTGNSYAYLQYTPVAGRDYIFRAKIQAVSGADTNIGIRLAGAGAADVETVFDLSDGQEKVISLPITAASTATLFIGVDNRAAEISGVNTAPTKIVFTELQLEDATGRADTTTPSEYVSSGVGTGSELWDDDPDVVGSEWTDNGDGTYTCVGVGGTFSTVAQNTAAGQLQDGGTYIVEYTITGYSGGGVYALLYGGDDVHQFTTRSANGTYREVAQIDNTTGSPPNRILFFNSSVFNGTIGNISVKRIDHGANVDGVKYFPYLNPNTVASNVLTDTGSRIGIDADKTELVTNGRFDTDSDWTKGAGWSIAAGVATHTGASAGGLTQTILTPGVHYEISFEATLAGTINVYAGDTLQAVSTSGTHKLTLYCTGNGILQFYGASDYTLDNVSVRKVDTIKGLMMEGAATELSGYSNDFTNWTFTSNATATQNAVGLDGAANSAWTMTDNSAAATQEKSRATTITDDSATYYCMWRIKYNASPSVYPRLRFILQGGTPVLEDFCFDPSDGSMAALSSSGTTTATRVGDWWFILSTVTNNSTGNTTAVQFTQPAYNTDASVTASPTAQGSTIYGSSELYKTTWSYSPVLTTGGTTKTRLADVEATIAGTAWPDGDVSVEFDLTPFFNGALGADAGIIAPSNATSPGFFFDTTAKQLNLNDGTNEVTLSNCWTDPGDTINVKIRANASSNTMNFSVDGTAATEGSYDDSFNPSGNIVLFDSGLLGAAIKNLRIFSEDLGEGWLTS